ncbi:MAG: EAL domain-containing protein [Proteobacteria bacterium]|nr:EAL domain-containing protein [Pseudomonadota bacterium]
MAQCVALMNGALVYFFMRSAVESTTLSLWLAGLFGVGVFRIVVYLKFRQCVDIARNLRRWEIISLLGAILSGSTWGAAGIVLFLPDSVSHQAFISFVLAGMTAGAVTTLSVQLPAALIFIFLAIAPLTYRIAMTTHEFNVPMSVMTALFMIMMMIASIRFYRNYRDTLAEGLHREAAEKELAKIAYYDPLTELPNRRMFADHLRRAVAASRRDHSLLAVCYLDLDNFKLINDEYGHDVGDRVLVQAANMIRESMRGSDVLGRWGGDEFALLLTNLKGDKACTSALNRLVEALSNRQDFDGISCSLSASVGVALARGEIGDPDILLRQADQAMYLAKRAGRNGYHIFNPDSDGEDRRRNDARQQLTSALDNDELILYFQPKVDMNKGVVYGAEALLRWRPSGRGIVSPGEFLPMWEADESMTAVDRWVLETAIKQLDRWLDDGIHLVLSVNVSAWLLHDTSFTDYLQNLFTVYPRTRGMIELEVTETRALDDILRVSEVMKTCSAMQVEFALDDFGTGFSSLVHLQQLPAHTLKIDTSFVRAMLENDNDNDRNLVKGIIGLGEALGKKVIAAGVETVAHGNELLKLGCSSAQGYGIAKPMPAEEFPAWMAHYMAPASWCRGIDCGPRIMSEWALGQ